MSPDRYERRVALAAKAADAAQRIAEDLAQLEHMAPLVSALSLLSLAHTALAEQLIGDDPDEPEPDGRVLHLRPAPHREDRR